MISVLQYIFSFAAAGCCLGAGTALLRIGGIRTGVVLVSVAIGLIVTTIMSIPRKV